MSEWRGRWHPKPGSIMPDGSIAGQRERGFQKFYRGEIWLTRERAEVAERFGWEIMRREGRGLVLVRRTFSEKSVG